MLKYETRKILSSISAEMFPPIEPSSPFFFSRINFHKWNSISTSSKRCCRSCACCCCCFCSVLCCCCYCSALCCCWWTYACCYSDCCCCRSCACCCCRSINLIYLVGICIYYRQFVTFMLFLFSSRWLWYKCWRRRWYCHCNWYN